MPRVYHLVVGVPPVWCCDAWYCLLLVLCVVHYWAGVVSVVGWAMLCVA